MIHLSDRRAARFDPIRSWSRRLLRYGATALASGFGVGFAPLMPGTVAAAIALLPAWAIRAEWGATGLAAAGALSFAAGCWASGVAARTIGACDPAAVVIDEIAGQWLTLAAAPLSATGWIAGFALFRLFDICKPWPVGWADRRVTGGFGIMLDDALAAGYAIAVLEAARAIWGFFGAHS